ncbi:MAG: NUDIX hydrolase [Gemmataceae bacterium]|nr:NUDIX hydrolase [Gemmataceae bacterium]
MAIDPDAVRQAAAVAYHDGRICVVRSSSGKRWVVPKGCMEPGKTSGEIALQEAWEEGGLVGVLQREPVGSYVYEKFGNVHHVIVFLMRVTKIADDYPEMHLRERRWLSPADAIALIDEPGLRDIIRGVMKKKRMEVS